MITVSGRVHSTGTTTTRGRALAPPPPAVSRAARRLLDTAETHERRAAALQARALCLRPGDAALLTAQADAELEQARQCRAQAALTTARPSRDGGTSRATQQEGTTR